MIKLFLSHNIYFLMIICHNYSKVCRSHCTGMGGVMTRHQIRMQVLNFSKCVSRECGTNAVQLRGYTEACRPRPWGVANAPALLYQPLGPRKNEFRRHGYIDWVRRRAER